MCDNFSLPFFLLVISSLSCLMQKAYSTPLVDCSGVKNDDKIFLESSANIFLCQKGSLKQKGCYIERESTGKQCVWLDEVTNNVEVRSQLTDYVKDKANLNCTKLMSDGNALNVLRTKANLFRDCTQVIKDGEKKYETKYRGNPLCNVIGMQTYNLHNMGWEKCDETGEFELQSCPTVKPVGRCVTKEELYERIDNTPVGSDIRHDQEPLCDRVDYWTFFLETPDISTECIFDNPIKINKTKTTITTTTTTTTKATTTPTKPPTTSTSKPTTTSTTKKKTTTKKATTTESPTTEEYYIDYDETTTEASEETTSEEPEMTCKNGQHYNAYYHKGKPTHCVFPNEERSCLSFEKLRNVIRDDYLPVGHSNWDNDKETQMNEKLQYMDKWHGGWQRVHHMKHGGKRRALDRFDEYVGIFAHDEEEKVFSNIGPYSYCNFLINYFPLRNSILLARTEEPCPDPKCNPDDDDSGNDVGVPKSYPKPIRNVWYEMTEEYDDGTGSISATKCSISYVPGEKKCISLKHAMNVLSAVSDKSDLKDEHKKQATAARMRMFNVTKGRQQGYNFDRMMDDGVEIVDIVSALEQETLGFDYTDEFTWDIHLDEIVLRRMSITSFCTIYSELIPIKFDQDYIDTHFHECKITIDESDFPASIRGDPYEVVNYIPDSDEAQMPIN